MIKSQGEYTFTTSIGLVIPHNLNGNVKTKFCYKSGNCTMDTFVHFGGTDSKLVKQRKALQNIMMVQGTKSSVKIGTVMTTEDFKFVKHRTQLPQQTLLASNSPWNTPKEVRWSSVEVVGEEKEIIFLKPGNSSQDVRKQTQLLPNH